MTTGTDNPFVAAELSQVMTTDEVAEMLRLRPWTVNDLARRGELPAIKIGRSRRFLRHEIEGYIRAQVVKRDS